ncbi:MAG: NADH-quinone oxidoreductase subunit H [Kiritimatiellae bacterium]|nr:NADH-quinone oxidoreductase subunit H [Kiritimatiellia bacterium]
MNILSVILAAVLAPLFVGIVNQTKAFFGGRRGPGLFRLYRDLFKLVRKSCPRPQSSTWIFDMAQSVSLASVIAAAAVFPWTGFGIGPAVVPAVLFFYILAAGRFFTVIGALDAGNAFEGMGASREMQFSALVEPVVFVVLGFLVMLNGDVSLSGVLCGVSVETWSESVVAFILVFVAFYAVFLLENCRVPFDDPETHLELTMIHEAMLLDVGGVDLAFALYGAALKFELLAAFLVAMFIPQLDNACLYFVSVLGGVAFISAATGVVESIMARMRFFKTPQILLGALLMASLAVFFLACF